MASSITQNTIAEDSLTILSRIASSDKSAVTECLDIYGGMIWTMANKFTESNADAKKAAQEIFSDIWQNAERGDLSVSDEKLWIALIARRRLNEYGLSNKLQKPAKAAGIAVNFNSHKIDNQSSAVVN